MSVPVTAPSLYRNLKGVFAVHKHAGVTCSTLGNIILQKIVSDLGTYEQRPQKPMVKFVPRPGENNLLLDGKRRSKSSTIAERNLAMFNYVPANVDDLFDHPSVQGPRYSYEDFELTFGNMLDVLSSGIQLFGLQTTGKEMINSLSRLRFPRSYYLYGKFGLATTKFHNDAKVTERTTWDHISETKITRLLCMIQGSYRNAFIKSSNLDLDSQLAYEMASKGLLRPQTPTGPMIMDIKLHKLNPPDFVIDITCITESGQFLRKLIHEIGLELRSTAICTKVHCYRNAIFFDEDDSTFLIRELKADKLAEVMGKNNSNLISLFKEKRAVYFTASSALDEESNFPFQSNESVG
ncbi:pseudouridylate synthase TRUB2, mitochondrial-like [Styela clava]